MKWIDAAQVHDELEYRGLIDGLNRAHCGPAPKTDRFKMDQQRPGQMPDIFLGLAAWQQGGMYGVKLVSSFPGNFPNYGLPTTSAIYVLFDGETGRPLAAMDGTALTLRKTAADSALGTDLLANKDCKNLLMVGAGAMAPHLIQAHKAARPSIDQVSIWNRTRERAEALVSELASIGIAATVVDDLAGAARSADIISCATMSTAPLIEGAWLKPGCHVDLVGAFTADMRETDDEAIARAEVFLDWWGCVERIGDLMGPINSGRITRDHLRADLYELCGGAKAGRSDPTAITLFKNGGGGHLDLFVASYLWERVKDAD